jgi:acyl carrier protein
MGLDVVELIVATEVAFDVEIPNADAATFTKPRDVIDFLEAHLPRADHARCTSQRAFYQTRQACMRPFGASGHTLTPRTPLGFALPAAHRRDSWRKLGAELGVPRWPMYFEANWFGHRFGLGPQTLGEVAQHVATWYPARVRGKGVAWTRSEIERAFVALLEAETGVDMRDKTLESRFIEDLGID